MSENRLGSGKAQIPLEEVGRMRLEVKAALFVCRGSPWEIKFCKDTGLKLQLLSKAALKVFVQILLRDGKGEVKVVIKPCMLVYMA